MAAKKKRLLRKTPHRTHKHLRSLEEQALSQGYEPGGLTMLFMSDMQQKLLSWYEDIKVGRTPPDLVGQTPRQARDLWFQEMAAFMPLEEKYLEYFHGKIQRVEGNMNVNATAKVVNAEPLSDDEWQRRYGVEAAGGAPEGVD